MRSCLVLGSGRSGTSMVAGTLSKAGYFMGDELYPGRASNPKGFFEDREINSINEALLAQVLPKRPRILGRWLHRDRAVEGQRWLVRLPLDTSIPCPPGLAQQMQRLTQREPFCFKDPRFSYTLPAWRPVLGNAVFVCVFRDPATTATSMLKERDGASYLRSLAIDFDEAVEVWTLMYRHVLERHRHQGAWLFLHYDQVMTPEGLDVLESFVDARVDRTFAEPSLRHSSSERPVSAAAMRAYDQLCALARFHPAAALPRKAPVV